MIALDVDRMRYACNNVFNKKLAECHELLLHDSGYEDMLEEATLLTMEDGERIFNGHYIESLAYISNEFTKDYIYTLLYNNSIYANNSLGSEKLYWEIFTIEDKSTLLEKLYVISRLNINTNKKKNHLSMYDRYFHIYGETETATVDTMYIGNRVVGDLELLGFSITSNGNVVLMIRNKEWENECKSYAINNVIILMDERNREIHIVPANTWAKYDNDHPFLTIKPNWRDEDVINSDKKYMDKLGILKGRRIEGFNLIETSTSIPIELLDIIQFEITAVKELGWDPYVGLDRIMNHWIDHHEDERTNSLDLAYIAKSIADKYSKSCIYLNRIFEEWSITDLFSSVICSVQIFQLLTRPEFCEENHVKITNFMDSNGYFAALNISTPDSRVIFKEGINDYVKDLEIDDAKEVVLLLSDEKDRSSIYSSSIIVVDQDNNVCGIDVPLVGYNCLFEYQIQEGKEDKPLSLSFFSMKYKAMIIE